MFRPAAVAGQFYPADAGTLARDIENYLAEVEACQLFPRALIAPHAGYMYSGSTAAAAYACVAPYARQIQRVVLMGPSHHVYLQGIAVSDAEGYITPLGPVPIDKQAQALISDFPQVVLMNEAHAREHSLEVHLPFLQYVLEDFQLIPLVVGDCPAQSVSEVLDVYWEDEHTLIVISTDLSHFHDYETARRIDQQTTDYIEQLDYESIKPENACGCRPVNGLLYTARKRKLQITTLDTCNSGDTAGSKQRVVGYGAYAVTEQA